MIDYKKMYAILCGAVDEVIEPLEQIPMARAAGGAAPGGGRLYRLQFISGSGGVPAAGAARRLDRSRIHTIKP